MKLYYTKVFLVLDGYMFSSPIIFLYFYFYFFEGNSECTWLATTFDPENFVQTCELSRVNTAEKLTAQTKDLKNIKLFFFFL